MKCKTKVTVIIMSVTIVLLTVYGVIMTINSTKQSRAYSDLSEQFDYTSRGYDGLEDRYDTLKAKYDELSENHSTTLGEYKELVETYGNLLNDDLASHPVVMTAIARSIDERASVHLSNNVATMYLPYSDNTIDKLVEYTSAICLAVEQGGYNSCVVVVVSEDGHCVYGVSYLQNGEVTYFYQLPKTYEDI